MVSKDNRKVKAAVAPMQPADLIRQWAPLVHAWEPMAELDWSFNQDAITISDMRVTNALRYGVLYTRHEIEDCLYKIDGDLERRLKAFMGKA